MHNNALRMANGQRAVYQPFHKGFFFDIYNLLVNFFNSLFVLGFTEFYFEAAGSTTVFNVIQT